MISQHFDLVCEYASTYAREGWPVFPVHTVKDARCTCRSNECKTPGNHSEVAAATIDAATMHDLWQRWPDANIGVVLGEKSKLAVLSVAREPGVAEFHALFGRDLWEIETATVDTEKGWDLCLQCRPGLTDLSMDIAPGIELLGEGRVGLLPPSRVNRELYSWIEPGLRVAEPPDWFNKYLAIRREL